MLVFFSSLTANYIAKARVLCKSLKEHNPGAIFVLGLVDTLPQGFDESTEPFDRILAFRDIESIPDKESFLFKHTVTELCTAVKPFYAEEILKLYHADAVIYLDPDIGVFDSLAPLQTLLENHSIILTPHQLSPEKEDVYVRENEILFLKRGAFNLGFFGVKNDEQGLQFLHWWQDRLSLYCFDDNYDVLPELAHNGLLGLFTDQKWIDLVPSLFDRYFIIRDPGYNVCTWNLSARHIEANSHGNFTVNQYPLRFFHFSGYDNGGHISQLMKTLGYYPENKDVLQLTHWYDKQLEAEGQTTFEKIEYHWSSYDNGEPIKGFERKLYHIRKDAQEMFRNPFAVTLDKPCFYNWVRTEYARYFEIEKRVEDNFRLETRFSSVLNKFLPLGSKRRDFVKKILGTKEIK